MKTLTTKLAVALSIWGSIALANPGDRLVETVTDPVRDCTAGWNPNMPLIAWGADGVVAHANGGSLEVSGGLLDDAGLGLSLSVIDDFEAQLTAYLACETPYLRGTLGMLAAAAPVTEFDPRTEQIVFFKHSFSAGDGIVVSEGIERIADLGGKRIAIQANGPHMDFVGRILSDGGLSFDDVEVVWVEDLTGDGDTPAAALASGQADAAAV
ncbi:MAG: ABC transporter substrate-binding protein, partial [Marinomonas sp.]